MEKLLGNFNVMSDCDNEPCYLYHVEVVEADGQGQPGEEHSTEEQTILVSGVVGGDVVQVEDTDAEHSEVGTDAQVCHYANRQPLWQFK